MKRAAVALALALSALLLHGERGSETGPELELDEREHASVAMLLPDGLAILERRGLDLGTVLGESGPETDALAKTPVYGGIAAALEEDLRTINDRPKVGGIYAPNRLFDKKWLRDPRGHFELVGVLNRLDRRVFEPGCGEVRLVYRLALSPAGRPTTRLPMTMNVILRQPEDPGGGCTGSARRWLALPSGGLTRVDAVERLVTPLLPPARIETNLQNLHGPAFREDQDDHAEYLLRSFDVLSGGVRPHMLLDTPRLDLSPEEKADLARFVRDRFDDVDRGTMVLPDRFLAMRAVSFAPRGLARPANRPFTTLLADADLAGLPYERAATIRSRAALLRRLDEMACPGCHESRAIAGFHLLGEDRDHDARFNALALGASNHLREDLRWRREDMARVAAGVPVPTPRPLPERPNEEPRYGSHCGLGDAGFASWTCPEGMRCRDLHHDEVGVCVPLEPGIGDPCEDARVERRTSADGDLVRHAPPDACVTQGEIRGRDACSPNVYGFPGGMCSEACTAAGERIGGSTCADLPASGYETECFLATTPIEQCLVTHSARRRTRTCDEANPCRDDYACARVPGLPAGTGACVPPYFVFQARVDGPLLDR